MPIFWVMLPVYGVCRLDFTYLYSYRFEVGTNGWRIAFKGQLNKERRLQEKEIRKMIDPIYK